MITETSNCGVSFHIVMMRHDITSLRDKKTIGRVAEIISFVNVIIRKVSEIVSFVNEIIRKVSEIVSFVNEIIRKVSGIVSFVNEIIRKGYNVMLNSFQHLTASLTDPYPRTDPELNSG